MAAALGAEEIPSASSRYIASVTLPDGQQVTTNESISEAFCSYFQDLFTREPDLSSSQFDTHLADFPRFEVTGCECRITEVKIREALSTLGTEKAPGIDGLPYEFI